ncbi:hypothetical protein JCM16358_20490 [Halanaerocella petrolearia]
MEERFDKILEEIMSCEDSCLSNKIEMSEICHKDQFKYNQIEDDRVTLEVLEQAADFGPQMANRHLKRACNLLREGEIVVEG